MYLPADNLTERFDRVPLIRSLCEDRSDSPEAMRRHDYPTVDRSIEHPQGASKFQEVGGQYRSSMPAISPFVLASSFARTQDKRWTKRMNRESFGGI